MKKISILLITALFLSCNLQTEQTSKEDNSKVSKVNVPVTYNKENVDGINIFYREAGNRNNPTLVLLHGFPTSSHQYRKVLTELSDEYHVIAPDYPGFGESDFPRVKDYDYTFDNIANSINSLLEQLSLNSYVLMIQDYGAPIGFRIATDHPERVRGLIIQNGNAYEEGIGEQAWANLKAMWANRNPQTEKTVADIVFSYQGLKWQYTHGTKKPELINPDNWNLDFMKMNRAGAQEMNLNLLYDYKNNLKLYPKWQSYLRENQPPTLIVWGKNDEFFTEEGAKAYKKDLKNIDYNILDTGHFALEEEGEFIIEKIRGFMKTIE